MDLKNKFAADAQTKNLRICGIKIKMISLAFTT